MSCRKRINNWLIIIFIVILVVITSHFCGNNNSDDILYNTSSTSLSSNNYYCSAFQIQKAQRQVQVQIQAQGEQFYQSSSLILLLKKEKLKMMTTTQRMSADTNTNACTSTSTNKNTSSVCSVNTDKDDKNENDNDSTTTIFQSLQKYVHSLSNNNPSTTETTADSCCKSKLESVLKEKKEAAAFLGDVPSSSLPFPSVSELSKSATTFTCQLIPFNDDKGDDEVMIQSIISSYNNSNSNSNSNNNKSNNTNNDTVIDIINNNNNEVIVTDINTLIFRPIVEERKQFTTTTIERAEKESRNTPIGGVYAVAILPSSKKVDILNLSYELSCFQKKFKTTSTTNANTKTNSDRDNNSYDRWELAPSHTVKELCGFVPGSIPPILTIPTTTNATMVGLQLPSPPPPFATIVDSSLLTCDMNRQLLVGGGGNSNYRCFVDTQFLIENILGIEIEVGKTKIANDNRTTAASTPMLSTSTILQSTVFTNKKNNAKIANIVRFDGEGMTTTTTTNKQQQQQNNNKSGHHRYYKERKKKKPYFPIAPPSLSSSLLQQHQHELEPHRPVPVTTIGRLTSVRKIAKRLVFADLAPPDYNYQPWLYNRSNNTVTSPMTTTTMKKSLSTSSPSLKQQCIKYNKNASPPWRSGEDDQDMYVQIIVGKTFCEKYDDDNNNKNSSVGIERLKELKPGRLILIKGAANIDPMQKNGWKNSVGNWAQKRSLDIIISSFTILSEDDIDSDNYYDDNFDDYENDDSNINDNNSKSNLLLGLNYNNNNEDEKKQQPHQQQQQYTNWNSLLPWERKHEYERRAVAGSTLTNEIIDSSSLPSVCQNKNRDTRTISSSSSSSSSNILTLDRFNTYLRAPLKINIVDTNESIELMGNHIRELCIKIGKEKNIHMNMNVCSPSSSPRSSGDGDSICSDDSLLLLKYVAGVDCEWRPTGAYCKTETDGSDNNPVALLQICIPAINQVYLLDTHSTIRPNLSETDSMTSNEDILSKTINMLFNSNEIVKVGYNVAMDFRRLAASFPHIPGFRNVRSVVELSTLAQRLHHPSSVSTTKLSPGGGSSLLRLTKLVLGYTISKKEQCSNWEVRPLTSDQVEYATLDCALPTRLLDEMAEGSGTAKMKKILPQVTSSWRFQTLHGDKKDAIRLLNAKRVVGNTFVVSQSWLQAQDKNEKAPVPVSIPEEGGGPYTDKSGVLRMPAHFVSIGGGGDTNNEEASTWRKKTLLLGKRIGKSKSKCISLLIGDTLPEGANLEYNARSGFVSFRNGLALFVNLPGSTTGSSRKMLYPNEWLEDGQMLTWFIRRNDWDGGKSDTAKLLGFRRAETNNTTDTLSSLSSNIVLFTRIGNGDFVCCGKCTASIPDDDDENGDSRSNRKLIKLHLHLNDWENIKDSDDFSLMLVSKKNRDSRRNEVAVDSILFQKYLASSANTHNSVIPSPLTVHQINQEINRLESLRALLQAKVQAEIKAQAETEALLQIQAETEEKEIVQGEACQ